MTMSHNPLLSCSPCGILTQKCQRSLHWFIRIPYRTSHMPFSCEFQISNLTCLTVTKQIQYPHMETLYLYCMSVQTYTHTCSNCGPKYMCFIQRKGDVQIIHTIPCCSVAKAVVVKFYQVHPQQSKLCLDLNRLITQFTLSYPTLSK